MNRFLLPESELREDGAGPVVESTAVSEPAEGEVLLTLCITQALEREDLQVSVWGSPDGGESWGDKPLVEFPAKSYCGSYTMPLNLRDFPGIHMLRAAWKMHSWRPRRQELAPETFFGFSIEMRHPEAAVMRASAAAA